MPIELVNDSGVGIWNLGTQESLVDYWNSAAFIPASCSACIGEDGNLTGHHQYQIGDDENVRLGFISSTANEVITGYR